MNMNLRELYLADNKLNGLQDSAQLGNLLKFNYNIQILDLRNNHILDSGTRRAEPGTPSQPLCIGLAVVGEVCTMSHRTLRCVSVLCVLSCVCVVTGLAYVCEGLKEQRKGLVTLVLWNNQLTHNGMGYLAAALVNSLAQTQ